MRNGPVHALLAAVLAAGLPGCFIDDPPAHPGEDALEARVDALRDDPAALRELLVGMPKGGDLHNHLAGAIAAETLIGWGAADGACVDPEDLSASLPPCIEGAVSMSQATPGTALFSDLVTAWSIRGFTGDLAARHDHFFDTFVKLVPVMTAARIPEGVAEIANLAGRNHQQYLELQHDFDSYGPGAVAEALATEGATWDEAYLLALREKILADPSFAAAVEATRADLAAWPVLTAAALRCGTDQAQPGCDVEVRWMFSGCRVLSREFVFGQWVYAYELAQVAPSLVGVNLVKPEENTASLQYYDDEMRALGVLSRHNAATPGRAPVHVSLHAGELSPAFVPAQDAAHLTFHIRHAVELAGAERIGHGVDVLGETAGAGVEDLLGELRARGVLVEICLTSNAELLGVSGDAHPFHAYRRHGVPVALSTDDEAMFESDITTDFVRAVSEQRAGYLDLKELSRASLEHAFLPDGERRAQLDRLDRDLAAFEAAALSRAP
jgi:adenosine deaminase